MAENHNKALECDDGFGANGVWIGGGSTDPTSSPPSSNPPEGSIFKSTDKKSYRKFGPNVGDWEVVPETDHHAGFNLIEASKIVEIIEGKNMVSYGLDIDGQLDVEGYLLLEA